MRRSWTKLVLAASIGAASIPAAGQCDEVTAAPPAASAEGPALDETGSVAEPDFAPEATAAPQPASPPQPLPAVPASPAPLPPPTRIASGSNGDAFLSALWRLQDRIYDLEQENRRLTSNLNQLQDTAAFRGRSSRFFQVSPLRSPDLDALGAAPVHYQAELAALEQSRRPAGPIDAAAIMPPDGTPVIVGGCEPGDCNAYGEAYGQRLFGDGCGWAGVFEFSLDWLNWKANRGGLDFLISGNDANDAVGPGNLKRVRMGRDNGLRLGLFRRTASGWDFGIRYTEFDLRGRNSVFDPVGLMSATRIHPSGAAIGDADITQADSRYKLQYDIIDLEVGRSFGIGSTGAVRPFAGLRSARIDQDLNTLYSNTPGFTTGDVVSVNETANMSSVGMLFGSEAHWHLRERYTVFGRAAAGLHVGTFDISNFQFEPDNGDVIVLVKDDQRNVVTSLEAAAGVGCRVWDRRWAAVDLEVGYEIQYWDNLSDFVRFVDDANDALNDRSTVSLGLDGVFARLTFTR